MPFAHWMVNRPVFLLKVIGNAFKKLSCRVFQDLSQGYLTVYKKVSHLSLPYSISSKVQKCLPFWVKKFFFSYFIEI